MSILNILERKLGTNIRQHTSNGFMLALSSVTTSFAGLAVTILFANILTKEAFGNYRYILGLLNVFNSFALSGMNSAVVQAVAKGYEGTLQAAINKQLKWALLHTSAGLMASFIFYLYGNILAAICLFFIAIILPTSNAFNTYTAYLQGKKDFRGFSLSNALQAIVVYSFIAIAAFTIKNIIIISIANITATLSMNLILHFYTVRKYHPTNNTDSQALVYGKTLSFLWGLRLAADQIETFLIHSILGPAPLASYAVITTIPERLKGFIKIGPSVAFPDFAKRTLADIVPPLRKKMAILFIILSACSAAYIILSPWVFRIIYPLYTDIIPLAQLYGVSLIFGLWTIPLTILFSQKESKTLSKVLAISSILQGCIMAMGLFFGGLFGAITAKLIYQAVQFSLIYAGLEYSAKYQRANPSTI